MRGTPVPGFLGGETNADPLAKVMNFHLHLTGQARKQRCGNTEGLSLEMAAPWNANLSYLWGCIPALRALCVCVCVLTFYFLLQLINNAVLFQVHSKVLQTVPLCVQTALCCEAWSGGFLELSPVPVLLIGCNDSQPWLNIRITCEVVNKQTTTTKPLGSVKSESAVGTPVPIFL